MSKDPVAEKPDQTFDISALCLAITNHSPLPMAMVEGATRLIRYGNPAFCALMGKSQHELLNQPLHALLPDKDACLDLIDRVYKTRLAESYTEKDPSKPHPVFWSYTLWPVEDLEGLVGLMIQVTETARVNANKVAMNEALVLSSLRQHELTETAENLNVRLYREIAQRSGRKKPCWRAKAFTMTFSPRWMKGSVLSN